ncbi:MAG: phosphatidate cytidylyltransferase [Eubacteriales bacterium]
MKTRIISSLFMVPFVLVPLAGGKVLTVACMILTAVALYEFFNGFKSMGIMPILPVAYVSLFVLYGINLFADRAENYMVWGFLSTLACLLTLFDIQKREIADALATLAGIFYVTYFVFHIVKVEQTGEFNILIWLVFITAFGTDIMAYFSGYFFGKHKLCEKISPKKTIEGSIGGIIGSVIFSALFAQFFAGQYLIHAIFIGVLGGAFSQLGDLTASIFKRKMGIKDYGKLIPGHGGVLDRIDSVMFTAPMVYYYIVLFMIK